jgi:hypothetical protein
VTAAKSGAQDDWQGRAEDTAATVTETSRAYATPIEMLGQPSLDGRREPTSSLVVLLLAEQRRGWSLMIFCAHATRGLRRLGRERPGALLARRTRTVKGVE